MTEQLIKTRYRVVQPEHKEIADSAICEVMWGIVPAYMKLRSLVDPLVGGWLEHVTVLSDFEGGTKFIRSDVFVHTEGHGLRLPRNEIATAIYRRATLLGRSGSAVPLDAEELPWIAGPMVLFDRQVWF